MSEEFVIYRERGNVSYSLGSYDHILPAQEIIRILEKYESHSTDRVKCTFKIKIERENK